MRSTERFCRLSSAKITLLKMERLFRIPFRELSDIVNTIRDFINANYRQKLTDLSKWSPLFEEFAAVHHQKTGRLPNVIGFVDGKVFDGFLIKLLLIHYGDRFTLLRDLCACKMWRTMATKSTTE